MSKLTENTLKIQSLLANIEQLPEDRYWVGKEEGRAEGEVIGYDKGYEQGNTDGYEEGNEDGKEVGYADALAKRTELVVTQSGEYEPTEESTGFKKVTVDIEEKEGLDAVIAEQIGIIEELSTALDGKLSAYGKGYDDALDKLTDLVVTENGEYAPTGESTGFKSVSVEVPETVPILQDKTFTENGTYVADEGYTGLGTVTVDVAETGGIDTSDATATAADILKDKTAYVNGQRITGTIPFAPSATITPTAYQQTVISKGYYANGDIKIKSEANLIPENIRYGKSIFGVTGTFGQDVPADYYKELFLKNAEKTLSVLDDAAITTVGEWLFAKNYSLKTVNLPNCTQVGGYAFSSCYDLSAVSLPNVTYVGAYAFHSCSMTSLYLPALSTVAGYAFSKCQKLTSIDFPNVSWIGSYAFNNCPLTSISMPKCTYISHYAFVGAKVSSIYLPELTTLGSNAFASCSNLVSVNLPKITYIQGFNYCSNLSEVNAPNAERIYSSACLSCSSLKRVIAPKVSYIEESAFRSCISLESANFPKVRQLGNGAFYGCTSLKEIDFPCASLVTGEYVFFGCTSVSKINLPVLLRTSGYNKSVGMPQKATEINMPLIEYIPSSNFYSMGNFTKLELANCSMIMPSAFCGAGGLKTLILRSNAVVTLSHSNALWYTRIYYSSQSGSIYVRPSLVEAYKTATNWTYYSSRIAPIPDDLESCVRYLTIQDDSGQEVKVKIQINGVDIYTGKQGGDECAIPVGNEVTIKVTSYTGDVAPITATSYWEAFDEDATVHFVSA